MKRIISVLLAVLMVLSLCACEARENKIAQEKAAKVDEMIYNLGTITIYSRIPIEKAEAAYEALDERAKAMVTRHDELVEARKEFLRLRREGIIERVEAAKADFEKEYNARVYFLTLADIRKDCHENEFDVVDDAVKAAEELCYPGTHFIQLRKILEKNGTLVISKDGKTATYKENENAKAVKALYAELDKAQGTLTGVSKHYVYRFTYSGSGNDKDASIVWGAASNQYSEHLALYNLIQKDLDWGISSQKGKSGLVYADELGNELQYTISNTSYSYYYQILIKYAE